MSSADPDSSSPFYQRTGNPAAAVLWTGFFCVLTCTYAKGHRTTILWGVVWGGQIGVIKCSHPYPSPQPCIIYDLRVAGHHKIYGLVICPDRNKQIAAGISPPDLLDNSCNLLIRTIVHVIKSFFVYPMWKNRKSEISWINFLMQGQTR